MADETPVNGRVTNLLTIKTSLPDIHQLFHQIQVRNNDVLAIQ
jgi:hypothetical protein